MKTYAVFMRISKNASKGSYMHYTGGRSLVRHATGMGGGEAVSENFAMLVFALHIVLINTVPNMSRKRTRKSDKLL